MDAKSLAISDRVVRLIQVFFGVILAQGVLRNSELVVAPLAPQNLVATLGFCAMYFAVVRSWIDWHITIESYPYDLNSKHGHRSTEMGRVWSDLLFVITYAFLIFTLEPLVGDPGADIANHLLGIVVAFGLYLASGLLRRRTYGIAAGKIGAIGFFGLAYLAIYLAYLLMASDILMPTASNYMSWVNAGFLGGTAVMTAVYRAYREYLRKMELSEGPPDSLLRQSQTARPPDTERDAA